MLNKQVLIIDEMHSSISELLINIGLQPTHLPRISRQEIIDLETQYIGLIVRSKTMIDEALLSSQKELKFVARAGAGIDRLDLEYLTSRNIAVFNAPEGNRDALGEHVIGMLLNICIQLRKADQEVRNKIWDREGNRGFELSGKTIGLLGYGHMGSAVAEKLSGFGCRVIAYDRHKSRFTDLYVEEVSMADVFEQSDIFSVHVPLTAETKSLVDENFLNKFKKDIIFINAARGEVVVLQSVLNAISSGKVKAAALDVLENEKITKLTAAQSESFEQLIKENKVLLTPHIGGWTFESYQKINEVIVSKIANYLRKSEQ